MKAKYFRIGSHIYSAMLGGYATSQFKFDTPIEIHRWAISSFILIMLIVATFNTKDK